MQQSQLLIPGVVNLENQTLEIEYDLLNEITTNNNIFTIDLKENQQQEQIAEEIKLDYTIQDPQQRNKLVHKLISTLPPEKLTHKYLEVLSNYLIFAMTKEQKKSKIINTDNRMITINKRQTSFEGLISKFENGEDSIYSMIANDKNIIFMPKFSITQEDIDTISELKELRQEIKKIEEKEKEAKGRKKFLLKKQLIEMRQDQYVIKNSFKPSIYMLNATKSFNSLILDENIQIINGEIHDKSLISFFNYKHISALLCNYTRLKQDCWGKFYTDGYYLMEDLDNLIEKTLKDKYPLYYDLLIYKIDGKQNIQIQELLERDHGIKHSVEYISSLWRKKIPKLLANQAEEDYLLWYYTNIQKGKWKRCTRCGQIKLVHNKFFSKNNSSRDGFYSICKDCRNKKNKKEK